MTFLKRTAIALAAAALLVGAACSPATPPVTGGATPTPTFTASDAIALVTQSCQAIAPTVAAVPAAMQNASAQSKAQATNIMSYASSACSSAEAIQAVALKGDPSQTATWITALGAGLTVALPAVLEAVTAAQTPATK